jgi:succinate dehydrogenase / fumarate reductase cytochrome b subunit
MSWLLNFYRSALGKKVVMAVSGVVVFGWITAHMIGNLKIFMGAEHINAYAAFLRTMGAPAIPDDGMLWISRIVLVICVGLHILAATQLTLMNWKARPVKYSQKEAVVATYAARTMRWGGVIILLFIIFHLLHLTTGTIQPGNADFRETTVTVGMNHQVQIADVYHNVVAGFQVWWVSAFYILAQIALGFHLYHGLWSMFQSVGLNAPAFNAWRRTFATAFAFIIAIGNISIPVAVLTGYLK